MTSTALTYEQVVNQPFLYVNNLQVAWGSNTTLTVAAGQCRDSTNVFDMTLASSVTINTSVVGVNGIDTGTIGSSKTYYVLLISDSRQVNATAALVSLSATAPTMPTGYDTFRVIDVWLTDGSSHFIKGYVVGNGSLRQHYHDANISVLPSGTATSLTNIDLTGSVPAVDNIPVFLMVDFTPNAASDKVSFAPAGSTATLLPHVSGSVATKINSGQLKVLSKLATSLPTIQYINSAASGSTNAWVCGFDYFI